MKNWEIYGKLPKTFMAVWPCKPERLDMGWCHPYHARSIPSSHQKAAEPTSALFTARYRWKTDWTVFKQEWVGVWPLRRYRHSTLLCHQTIGNKGLSTELNYDYWKRQSFISVRRRWRIGAPTLFDLSGQCRMNIYHTEPNSTAKNSLHATASPAQMPEIQRQTGWMRGCTLVRKAKTVAGTEAGRGLSALRTFLPLHRFYNRTVRCGDKEYRCLTSWCKMPIWVKL